jgi:hypothetical protein
MTIAHIRRNKRATPPQDQTLYSKEDISYIAKLVPNFAARWHSFGKYFFTPDVNNQRKQINATTTYRDNPFTN